MQPSEAEAESLHVGLDTFFGKQNAAAAGGGATGTSPQQGSTPVGSPLLDEGARHPPAAAAAGGGSSSGRLREETRDQRNHLTKVCWLRQRAPNYRMM